MRDFYTSSHSKRASSAAQSFSTFMCGLSHCGWSSGLQTKLLLLVMEQETLIVLFCDKRIL
ncbi:hypothetical protein COCSUDRAFT_53143 [Coccomyxa subellipsoidea C-169]|uniref:Uncharacterized protein n=1 Tax=Coccomyxa subellipsoidea (strain C-169) TaxID=574566 RepID=I0YZP1_COCSC|nr:hypothetical protein COCSUDRAFT_53143 [Coccomyxa subellipsoidea C-169]EIE23860.1 hypothetical protein COCSUDRAFT_53143 [Coccomyxa subellipsoidea C-169]|eukprot:XP_005648404.1 hypothetical protein COCSUDRAFT_53143 [Coccomyxa subellipsoidea C-169]